MQFSPRALSSYGPILVAALIAGSVYLLVAVRFGQPLREAKDATAKINDMHERLPSYVERAVTLKVGPGISPDEIAKLRHTVAELGLTVDGFRGTLERTRATANTAYREVEEVKRSAAASRAQPAGAPAATVMATPAPEFTMGPSEDIPGVAIATATAPAPAPAPAAAPAAAASPAPVALPPAPPKALAVAKDGPMQMELLGHRITSNGIVLDLRLTRISGGDARVTVTNPNISYGVKIVTSDGYEFGRGGVVPPSATTVSYSSVHIDLIEGTPIRVTYLFEGKFDRPVLCSRIELRAWQSGGINYAFRFSDILVSPE